MRPTLALLALPAATLAVSLVDFPPRVTGLSTSCQAVYTEVIDGCSDSDFASPKSCSVGCIEALQAMTEPVQQACSSDTNVGGTVINAFLHNAGTGAICGNAASVLATMSSTVASSTVAASSSAAGTSSAAAMSTTAASSSAADSATSSTDSTDTTAGSTSSDITSSTSSIILSGTSTASPLATTTVTTTATSSHTTSTALSVDTSSSPSASSHKPSATGDSQNGGNSNSGGGSPFDSTNNQASAGNALEVLSYGVAGVCGLVFAMVWL